MKGDHVTQPDNQPSISPRVMRGSRTRRRNKSPDVSTPTTAASSRRRSTSLENDNRIVLVTASENLLTSSGESGYSSSGVSAGEQTQGLVPSPVHRRRPSSGTLQRAHSQDGNNPRYNATRRRSLPVIFEQDDPAILVPSSSSSSLHRRNSRPKLKRRPTSVSDAVIGTSYSYPGVRRKGSTILLDRRGIKKRTSTLGDGFVTGGGAVVIPTTPHGPRPQYSRRTSEVYSVIPIKSQLPQYGFIIQRNPCMPPIRNTNQRRRSVTVSGYPHQVRRPSTISIDEISRRIAQTKLERKDSKVKFSVVEEVSSRRGSLRRGSDGNQSVSQVAESVYSSSSCTSSDSEESSSSENTSSEWTTDSSNSGSESSDNTDSSYTTTSSSTSSSSDSDSSSDDSSSLDEEAPMSRSTSRSTFLSDYETDTTSSTTTRTGSNSSAATSSVATDVTKISNKSENFDRSKSSRGRSGASTSSSPSKTIPDSGRIRKASSSLSRSNSRSSSFRSSSSSPIKSRRKCSSASRTSHASSSLEHSHAGRSISSSSSPKHSHSRKNSVKSRTREDYIDLATNKGYSNTAAADGRASMTTQTPAVIVHKSTEDRLDVPSSNGSVTCIIL